MSECIITLMELFLLFMMYVFIIKPLNRCYEAALNYRLGKEIARRLYGEIDPHFIYKASQEDDLQRHIILSSAIEEFRRLLNKPTMNKNVCDV